MDGLHINSEPHALSPPGTPQHAALPRPDSRPSAPGAGLVSGLALAASASVLLAQAADTSPVLRPGHAKPAGAKNTTYSQPVIVRTYSGPSQSQSQSPSTSSHYRRPSRGSSRHGSQVVGPTPTSTSTTAASREAIFSAESSQHVHGLGDSPKESLFSMARSRVKKTLLPWQWALGGDDDRHDDEARLPPVEAFTYKGFLADLQTNTSIRADLDRIAEICAHSRYSLSDQYDAHVVPHGSGAAFATSGQPPLSHSKGRRKTGSNPGGPTLQAVPSDDDENGTRAYRRRRGGAGRRRSAAYGTLETIMSSSRSSEEEMSKKKKSAAEIADEVRGRATRKAQSVYVAATDAKPENKPGNILDRKPSNKPGSIAADNPHGKPDDKAAGKSHTRSGDKPPKDTTPSSRANGKSVESPSPRPDGKHVQARPRPISFAHAVIDSNRHPIRRVAQDGPVLATAPTTAALLGVPATPQTSNNLFEIHAPLRMTSISTVSAPVPATGEAGESSTALLVLPDDADAAGFLSGLSNWIPWVGGPEAHNGQLASHGHSHVGPSHAEGSLRELLKTADGKPNKGKEVERPRQ